MTMTRKEVALIVLAVALGALYIIYFTDFFRKESLQIMPLIRGGRQSAIPRDAGSPAVYPVAFQLKGKHRLDSVKVVNAKEFATNKYTLPLWHMVADERPVPLDAILYGTRIPGMKPAVPRSRPKPLEAGIDYLIIVQSGKLKGQTNFITREYIPLGAPQ